MLIKAGKHYINPERISYIEAGFSDTVYVHFDTHEKSLYLTKLKNLKNLKNIKKFFKKLPY